MFTIDNKYYVIAALKKIHPAGYAEMSEFSTQIKEFLNMKKRVAKMAEETKAKLEGVESIEAASEKLALPVSSVNDVTFSSLSAGSSGNRFRSGFPVP